MMLVEKRPLKNIRKRKELVLEEIETCYINRESRCSCCAQ
jgi:hypothetical protein